MSFNLKTLVQRASTDLTQIKAAIGADISTVEAQVERAFHLGAMHQALQQIEEDQSVEVNAAVGNIQLRYESLKADIQRVTADSAEGN